jgi:hypothetical protein
MRRARSPGDWHDDCVSDHHYLTRVPGLALGATSVTVDLQQEPIAHGRTADIYPWQAGKVIKLFRLGWTLEGAELEARMARSARSAGLRVPIVGKMVKIHGRFGLIYDYHDAPSLLHTLGTRPWTVIGAALLFAEIQASIHACVVSELPSQRERLAARIVAAEPLSAARKWSLLRALDRLPDGERLCHGDFHPDNVLMEDQGPVLVDWADAARGNPWADVARTSLLLEVCAPPPGTPHPWLIELGRRGFHWLYLRRYTQLRPEDRWQLAAWRPVVAAARLWDAHPDELPALMRVIERES